MTNVFILYLSDRSHANMGSIRSCLRPRNSLRAQPMRPPWNGTYALIKSTSRGWPLRISPRRTVKGTTDSLKSMSKSLTEVQITERCLQKGVA